MPVLCLKLPLALQEGVGAMWDSPAQNGNATGWRIPSTSLLPLSQCFLHRDSLEIGLGTWNSIHVS